MAEKGHVTPRAPGRCLFLVRGESMVASAGLAVAAILLAAMGALAWWMSVTYRAGLEQVRQAEIRAAGDLLADATESLVEAGEMTTLRRVLADASRKYDLHTCRVVLPDGRTIADAQPVNIDLLKLPPSWEGQVSPDGIDEAGGQNGVAIGLALNVPNRGAVRLELAGGTTGATAGHWEVLAGAGLVGAIALIALLGVYRRMRRRLSALGAIREALLAYERGVTSETALLLSADFGAVAEAWNQLLRQKQQMNKELVEEKAGQMLGARREGRSDIVSACDALKQGLILVDDRLNTRYINGAAAVLLQTTREHCLNAAAGAYIRDQKVLAMLQSVIKGDMRRWSSVEVELGEEGGHTGVLRYSARPVRRDDSASAMIIIEDLTQQRVAEEARKSFVAQATHELRTPLTNIRLYVETALDEGEHDPAVRANCLNIINQETRRLERIVGDMLSVSEIEAGSIQLRRGDVRLEAIFEQLEAEYRAMASEKSIELTFDLPPKLPVLQGDRDKIVLAMHNLLGNALKYTPAGGRVQVQVEAEESRLLFRVNDTGIGIGADELELIFDKFYRARNSRQGEITGSGLGLALAREVARLHGGNITVDSELNKGSRFTMSLPVMAEAA